MRSGKRSSQPAAALRPDGEKTYPPGEFMDGTSIAPVDRPEIKGVSATWR
jgi:hypothetical protein